MKTFKQFLNEIRSVNSANRFYDKFQAGVKPNLTNRAGRLIGLPKNQPLFGKPANPIKTIKTLGMNYTGRIRDGKVDTVNIKDLAAGQPHIYKSQVQKYIDYYDKNPNVAKDTSDVNKSRMPHVAVGSDGKMVVADGHHRLAALASLGHKKVAVLKFQ